MYNAMKKKRIAYLDFIKVFTMFIVTFGHCAQALYEKYTLIFIQ